MKIKNTSSNENIVRSIFLVLILFCLFLGSLNLINRFYYCIYIAALLFVMVPGRKLHFDKSFLMLLIFATSLLIFDSSYQTMVTSMIKPFTYPLCYIMGLSLFPKEESNLDLSHSEKQTSVVIYVASGGVMLHFVLNMLTNRGANTRNVIDFWTKDEMSATGQATLACLMIAVAAAFLFSKSGKLKKTIAIASLAIILAYNLILAGRTIFLLILIVFAVALLYVIYENKRVKANGKTVKLIFAITSVLMLLILLYSSNAFGIRDTLESSNFYNRFFDKNSTQAIDDDSRLENKIYYIEHFFDRMLGGGHIRREFGHSAHDLYLDVYDEAGIFALISIVFYILYSIGRAIKCIRSNNISFETRLLILCIYLIVNIQFWLEPITRGIPWLLATYCLIDGAVNSLLSKEKDLLTE